MRFVSFAAGCAFLALAACGGWKSGQANSAQGNISKDSRPPATANSNEVANGTATNSMVMLAVPLSRDRALQVMKVRHDGMHSIADALKAIHRGILGTPDLATVRSNSANLVRLSQQAAGWFPAGTGPDVAKTRAKPEIWQSSEDFAAKLRNFQAAARAFDAAARGSDVAAMTARFADLDGTCKACHDKYRAEEQH
jgi:cytochrome c556